MLRSAFRLAAPALALAALTLAPFLDKAHAIDDTLFLKQAEHLRVDPLHPTAFSIAWRGAPERLSAIMPSGPVMAWLLLPTVLLGAREWIAHLTMLLVLGVALVATARLALRLGQSERNARLATLLVAVSPAVIAMAGTSMPDVPAMALGVLAIERLVAWGAERRTHQGLVAALLLALAAHTRSQLLVIGVPGALLVVGDDLWQVRRWFLRRNLVGCWPILVAPLLFWLIAWITKDPQSASIGLTKSLQTLGLPPLRAQRNAISFLGYWVLAMPFGIAWVFAAWRRLPWWAAFAFAGVIATWLVSLKHTQHIWMASVAGAGAMLLLDVLLDAIRRRDALQLALGAWLLLGFPVIFYLHMSPKYLVPSAPAMAILLARALPAPTSRTARALWTVLLGVNLAVGVLILRADARFANLGRRAATELIAAGVASGHTMWFAGTWGFLFYAERAGGHPVTHTPPFPAPGDQVVSTVVTSSYDVMRNVRGKTLIRSLKDATPGGRVMNNELGVGFYSNGWGYLPWWWGRTEIERYDVWEVVP